MRSVQCRSESTPSLVAAISSLLAIGVLMLSGAGWASAPMSQVRSPGFYQMKIGELQVTALNDGVVYYKTEELLPGAKASNISSFLELNGYDDPLGMSYNGFLVNTGRKLILFDTGSGGKLDDDRVFHGTGHLIDALKAAGYSPNQVDEVYITHQGPDHIGGLTSGAAASFPNAIVHAPKAEFGWLFDPKKLQDLVTHSEDRVATQHWIDFLTGCFEPYLRSRRLDLFDGSPTFPDGVRALATYGHSPGHTSYVISSNGKTLIVLGDLILSPMQFPWPALGSSFDADHKAAANQRTRVLSSAAMNHEWIAGGHISFPGIGRVRRSDRGFVFLPPQYDAAVSATLRETQKSQRQISPRRLSRGLR